MRRLAGAVALCSAIWAASLGCTQGESEVLATYPGGRVTQEELDSWLRIRPPRRRPDREVALVEIATTRALAAASVTAGLDRRPEVAAVLHHMEDRSWTEALRQHVQDGSTPTLEEVGAYLDEHRDKLEKPLKVRLWNIFKQAPIDGDPAHRAIVRQQMEVLRERLLAGEDFQLLARQESEAVNRFRGGKMGPVPPGTLNREVEEIAFSLEEGELSRVIAVETGFVILRCAGFVPAYTMPEEEALERIETALGRWSFEAAWEELRQELLASAAVSIEPGDVAAAAPEEVIARVGGREITFEDLRAVHERGRQGRPLDSLPVVRRKAVLEEHLFQIAAAERARRMELSRDPVTVDRVSWQRAELLAARELERRLGRATVQVATEEVRTMFEAEGERLQELPSYRLELIQLSLDDQPLTLLQQTSRGEVVLQQVRSGELEFAQAARIYSEHPSGPGGGGVGWWSRRQVAGLGPNVLYALDELEVGDISALIRQDHLWILHLLEQRPGRRLSFEEAAPQIRERLEQRARAALLAGLRDAAREALNLRVLAPEASVAEPGGDLR